MTNLVLYTLGLLICIGQAIRLHTGDSIEGQEYLLFDEEAGKTDMEKYISTKANVSRTNSSLAFSQLSYKEKNYAYYLAKASWAGAKIVTHQTSYEAPPLFVILHAFFQDKNYDQLEKQIIGKGITKEELDQFYSYAAAFYQYLGNYHSFGSKKFVPEM